MKLLCEVLQFFSAWMLGLFVGALLAEGALLVPHWRSLPAAQFFALYKEYKPRLYRFFEPLTIIATLLTLAAAVACLMTAHPGRWMAVTAAMLSVSMIVLYYLYFHRANASFDAATLGATELSAELARWAAWHWARVILGAVAFAASLLSFKAD
jgi:uncharacterized membrane protein